MILQNLGAQIPNRWAQIVAKLRSYGDQDLPGSGLELSGILRRTFRHTRTPTRLTVEARRFASRRHQYLKILGNKHLREAHAW